MNPSIRCSDAATFSLQFESDVLEIRYISPDIQHHALFLAVGAADHVGSAVLPFAVGFEGSSVFLPFSAKLLCALLPDGRAFDREWHETQWGDRDFSHRHFALGLAADEITFRLPLAQFANSHLLRLSIYAKDLAANDGWGWFFGCSDSATAGGIGDKAILHFHEIDLARSQLARAARFDCDLVKPRIYELFVRLFSNTNTTQKFDGTLAENGCGKFADITDEALAALRDLGFTHIWLTGVLRQATATDYSEIGIPADDPDVLKGVAGSPYAIKDYFDVSPDYAKNPVHRLAEFRALIQRIHDAGMLALMDFVPNHVARSYRSTSEPELDFGFNDDRSQFFAPNNNFFYLANDEGGPPLHLPYDPQIPISANRHRDGLFDGERTFGRVTGDNCVSWSPPVTSWYETVKLNYGYNFANGERAYPHGEQATKPIPDTWHKMDTVIAYWQSFEIDGFRCDMAHMVPPEFWKWMIANARGRNREVFFVAEAYNNDPKKVESANPVIAAMNDVRIALLDAGFNAIYDDPIYRVIKRIYEGNAWANDIDLAVSDTPPFVFQNSLRYGENHDEVRLAARQAWGGVGMDVGRVVCAILFGLSGGATLLYNGQEVGESGSGSSGFGNDPCRTTIFDYWSMPELQKWVAQHEYNDAQLNDAQKNLREFYSRLLRVSARAAFRDGTFFALNSANRENANFDGHWLYAFLRYDEQTQQRFLVVANLHRKQRFDAVRVALPEEALAFLKLPLTAKFRIVEELAEPLEFKIAVSDVAQYGLRLPSLLPLSARYLEISVEV